MTSHYYAMFRHQIARHTSLINSKSFPENVSAPGTPTNFSCQAEIFTQGVTLSWDAPTTGGPVFYYEIFRNGSKLANESDTIHQFDNPVNGDVFKVRAVGVRGLTSPFSGTCTYTGDESLDPDGYAAVARSSAHIMWTDLSGSTQISLEGYNVYLDGVKQNSSLLPTSVLGYPFFDLVVGNDYDVGVTFVHDGGQESGVFDVTLTIPDGNREFSASLKSKYVTLVLVQLAENAATDRSGNEMGLAVREGARVNIIPNFSFGLQHEEREWSSPSTHTYNWSVSNFGKAEMTFEDGCGNGLSINYNRIKVINPVTFGADEQRSVRLDIGYNYQFRFSGPNCNDPANFVISAKVSVPDGDDILDYGLYETEYGRFVEEPNDGVTTLTEYGASNADEVIFIWSTFPSTPYYDLYIRSKGGSFPGTPQYEDLDASDNFLRDRTLAPDTYEARLDYKLGDGSIATQSNILEFTIS